MAAALVTQELVNATANQLTAELGKRPSNRQVFSEIGFGSMTTISKLMGVWRSAAPALGADASRLPSQLVRELEQLLRDTEKAVRQDCLNDIENARDSEQLLIQENEQLQAQLVTVQTQMQKVHEDGMAAQAQVSQLQVENSSLKSALEAERLMANELRVDLGKASLRIEEYLPRLENELKESRHLLSEAYKAQANAELNAAVAIERAVGLEQRLGELKR